MNFKNPPGKRRKNGHESEQSSDSDSRKHDFSEYSFELKKYPDADRKMILLNEIARKNSALKLQRTGPSDLYSKPPRNPLIDSRNFTNGDHDLDDFSDEDAAATEPIYNGGR